MFPPRHALQSGFASCSSVYQQPGNRPSPWEAPVGSVTAGAGFGSALCRVSAPLCLSAPLQMSLPAELLQRKVSLPSPKRDSSRKLRSGLDRQLSFLLPSTTHTPHSNLNKRTSFTTSQTYELLPRRCTDILGFVFF